MKRASIILLCCLCIFSKIFSQSISLPNPSKYKDTSEFYYLTIYEEYLYLFDKYSCYKKPDTCTVDFSKYDLKGEKINGHWTWQLIYPKKYKVGNFTALQSYNTMQWSWLPGPFVINDTAGFNLLKTKTETILADTFDFNNTTLVYNNVWIDCRGTFDYKILYDPIENVIFCKLITYYGGSRGMCPKDDWIAIAKPKPDTKIKVQTISLY